MKEALAQMSSNLKPFTIIAVAVFAILALGHVLRVVFAWEIVIDGMIVPLEASIVVALIAAGLSFMVWQESRH